MKYYSQLLTLVLIAYYNIAYSHLVDIHIPTAEEQAMMERVENEKENEKAQEALENKESTFEEQLDALKTLMENGKLA